MANTHYTAFGLNIASCIPCPELSPGVGTPDVVVRYGAVPKSLDPTRSSGSSYEANPDHLFFSIDGVAKYVVSKGREILIDRAETAEDSEVRLFLLGSAFGALLRGLTGIGGPQTHTLPTPSGCGQNAALAIVEVAEDAGHAQAW